MCFSVQVSKAPHSGVTSAQETACRLLCAAGLAEMQNRKYKNAARLFCRATFEHCNFPDVSLSEKDSLKLPVLIPFRVTELFPECLT